jgi:hypothetical protein
MLSEGRHVHRPGVVLLLPERRDTVRDQLL